MKKKLLSLALALVMCLGLAVPAMAADYTEVVPCKYDWRALTGPLQRA